MWLHDLNCGHCMQMMTLFYHQTNVMLRNVVRTKQTTTLMYSYLYHLWAKQNIDIQFRILFCSWMDSKYVRSLQNTVDIKEPNRWLQ